MPSPIGHASTDQITSDSDTGSEIVQINKETERILLNNKLNIAKSERARARWLLALSTIMVRKAEARADMVEAVAKERSAANKEELMKEVTAMFDMMEKNFMDHLPGLKHGK